MGRGNQSFPSHWQRLNTGRDPHYSARICRFEDHRTHERSRSKAASPDPCRGRGGYVSHSPRMRDLTPLGANTMTNGNGAPPQGGNQPQVDAGAPPQLNVLAQYIKDLSFENPNAPRSLGPHQQQPSINVQINVGAGKSVSDPFRSDAQHRMQGRTNRRRAVQHRAGLLVCSAFRTCRRTACIRS